MDKSVTITVSRSTDPRTMHIGRFFVDIRDTTRDPNPVTAHQLAARVFNANGAAQFIGEFKREAARQNVRVTVKDTTDEIPL